MSDDVITICPDPENRPNLRIDVSTSRLQQLTAAGMPVPDPDDMDALIEFYRKAAVSEEPRSEPPNPADKAGSDVDAVATEKQLLQQKLAVVEKALELNRLTAPAPAAAPAAAPAVDLQGEMQQLREAVKTLLAAERERLASDTEKSPESEWRLDDAAMQRKEGSQGSAPPPKVEVHFDMGEVGTLAARYHEVVLANRCLVLVYDTRFEYGFQFMPPELGDRPLRVSVPKFGEDWYSCLSLGLYWNMGCLDSVLLVRSSEESA